MSGCHWRSTSAITITHEPNLYNTRRYYSIPRRPTFHNSFQNGFFNGFSLKTTTPPPFPGPFSPNGPGPFSPNGYHHGSEPRGQTLRSPSKPTHNIKTQPRRLDRRSTWPHLVTYSALAPHSPLPLHAGREPAAQHQDRALRIPSYGVTTDTSPLRHPTSSTLADQ